MRTFYHGWHWKATTRILCCHLTVTCALRLQRQNVMKQRKIDVVSSKKQVRTAIFSVINLIGLNALPAMIKDGNGYPKPDYPMGFTR